MRLCSNSAHLIASVTLSGASLLSLGLSAGCSPDSIGRGAFRSQGASLTLTDCTAAALIAAVRTVNLGTGPQRIDLMSGCTYTLTAADNGWYGPNGLPPITNDVTIDGHGAVIERSSAAGTPPFRLFFIAGAPTPAAMLLPGKLTLRNVTLRGGLAQGGNGGSGTIGGGGGMGAGGAIFTQGDTTLFGVTLTGNRAVGGDGGLGDMSSTTPYGGGGGGGMGGSGANCQNVGIGCGGGGMLASGKASVGASGVGMSDATQPGANAMGQLGGAGGGTLGLAGGADGGRGGTGGNRASGSFSGDGRGGGGGGGFGGLGGKGDFYVDSATGDTHFHGGDGGSFGGGGGGGESAGLFFSSGGFSLQVEGGGGGGGGGVGGGGGGGGPGDHKGYMGLGGQGGFGGGGGGGGDYAHGGFGGGGDGYGAGAAIGIGGSGGLGGGGAVFAMSGTLTVVNSTLAGNDASGGKGATSLTVLGGPYPGKGGNGQGGAIFLLNATARIVNATLANNTVTPGTGPLSNTGYAYGGAVSLVSYGAGTPAVALTLQNSILFGSKSAGTATSDLFGDRVSGTSTIDASAPNIIGSDVVFGSINRTGISTADPQLSALQSAGGPTQTMRPSVTSPANGKGDPTICRATAVQGIDQRGVLRDPASCTIGAFESIAYTPPPPDMAVPPAPDLAQPMPDLATPPGEPAPDMAVAVKPEPPAPPAPSMNTGCSYHAAVGSAEPGALLGSLLFLLGALRRRRRLHHQP